MGDLIPIADRRKRRRAKAVGAPSERPVERGPRLTARTAIGIAVLFAVPGLLIYCVSLASSRPPASRDDLARLDSERRAGLYERARVDVADACSDAPAGGALREHCAH